MDRRRLQGSGVVEWAASSSKRRHRDGGETRKTDGVVLSLHVAGHRAGADRLGLVDGATLEKLSVVELPYSREAV